jgi:hypothetical protein
LQGVLRQLYDLSLQLLSVNRIEVERLDMAEDKQ